MQHACLAVCAKKLQGKVPLTGKTTEIQARYICGSALQTSDADADADVNLKACINIVDAYPQHVCIMHFNEAKL